MKSGRTIEQVREVSDSRPEDAPEAPAPQRAQAMKAVLTDKRFSDPDWIYERKLDGIRCVAIRDGGPVRLLSRNDLSMNARYPEIADGAGGAQPCPRFAVDGEVVAFDGAQTSFAKLTQRAHRDVPVFLYVFDVLWLDGDDVRPLPLRERKRLLREALDLRRTRCASPRTATATARRSSRRRAARAGRA